MLCKLCSPEALLDSAIGKANRRINSQATVSVIN
uniref:Kinesin motor domain-containing protein n=1 Tax=Macrostomum lignano TaxID=282301 RepID=A0A1I8FMQ9_9PLAT